MILQLLQKTLVQNTLMRGLLTISIKPDLICDRINRLWIWKNCRSLGFAYLPAHQQQCFFLMHFML
jgi:hypothetical protein